MTTPTTRPATQDDIFLLEEIKRDAFEASYANFMPEQYIREWYDNNEAQRTVRKGLGKAGVVEISGMVAGFVMYEENLVTELWVSPMFQRKNAGRELLRWVENEFRSQGFKSYKLYCYEANGKALEFYKKNGFTRDSEFPSTHVAGGPVTVYVMRKEITSSTD